MLDDTHDPALRSWVASANDGATDFPIQNLPFGRFRRAGSQEPWRIGVAIGDQVLDLRLALEQSPWAAGQQALLQPRADQSLSRTTPKMRSSASSIGIGSPSAFPAPISAPSSSS